MFKFMVAATMLIGASANARSYLCKGNTVDGVRVTVSGHWDPRSFEATSDMAVSASDDFSTDPDSIPTSTAHYISSYKIHIDVKGDNWVIRANEGYNSIFIAYPNQSSQDTTMVVHVGGWKHAFVSATCQPNLP